MVTAMDFCMLDLIRIRVRHLLGLNAGYTISRVENPHGPEKTGPQ